MRISDWSSDVCSSDLMNIPPEDAPAAAQPGIEQPRNPAAATRPPEIKAGQDHHDRQGSRHIDQPGADDRTSVAKGKSVAVRVDPGGRRIIKMKNISR